MSNQAEKLVLDLETKKSFNEVEGRALRLLGVSVAGIYSYNDNEFKVFLESQIRDLIGYLQRAELIIGFNIKRFDFPVLQPYLDFDTFAASKPHPSGCSKDTPLSIPSLALGIFGEDTEAKPKYNPQDKPRSSDRGKSKG